MEKPGPFGPDRESNVSSVMSDQGWGGLRPSLQSVLDSVVDGLVVTDRRGKFLFFNRAATRILGIGPVEVPISAWPQAYGLFRDDETTPYPAESLPLARALNGQTVEDELIFVRNQMLAKGTWISVNATPWRDAVGEPLGAIATFRDITAKKASAEHVRHLSSAVEQTADGVLITDSDGNILYVNPAFERTSGYTMAEVSGQTPRLLRSGRHDSQFYADMWATLLSGHAFRGTLVNRKKTGELYHAEQTITPMRDDGGRITHYVSVIKDLTERMAALESAAEMQVAGRVQQRLYPRGVPKIAGAEVAGAAHPSTLLCGDYYDYFLVNDHTLCLVVGDVSGHGLGQALIMVETRAWLHSCREGWLDPSDVLRRLNSAMTADLSSDQYVTMLLATVDVRSRTLTYANAGHPGGYLFDRFGTRKLMLESTTTPLGMFPDLRGCSQVTIALEPGDLVLMLTDGFLESARPDGELIDVEELLGVIRRHHDAPVQGILDGLFERLSLFTQGQRPTDDVTAMICRVSIP